MKRYLGIDPGTTRIGYGIVEDRGDALCPVAWGILEKDPKRAGDLGRSSQSLRELISAYAPTCAAVERLFFTNNRRTAMAVSEMRGVIMLVLQETGIPVSEFTPQQVKLAVSGHGGATKRQVQNMVGMLLGIREPITPDDAADGLALALCCATSKKAY